MVHTKFGGGGGGKIKDFLRSKTIFSRTFFPVI